jgi:hypothetical protein
MERGAFVVLVAGVVVVGNMGDGDVRHGMGSAA